MNLVISLRSEVLKTKRTAAFYFTLIGAAIVPLIFLLNAFTDGLPDENQSNKDPLNAIFKIATETNALGIFPLFIVLVCTLLPQIEHKNNTWKQVLAAPKTKGNIFLAKFLNIQLLMVAFLIANHLFMWLVTVAIHFIIPDLRVLEQPLNGKMVLVNTLNTYLALFAISTIQFWLGMRFKNFLVPVAVGFFLWLTGTVLVMEYHSKLANYFPYSFHTFAGVGALRSSLNQVVSTSLIYGAVVLLLGFSRFQEKKNDWIMNRP